MDQQSSLPKVAMSSGTIVAGIIITLFIVVISAVLVGYELIKWKQFQMELGSTSLVKTIIMTTKHNYD